MKKLKKIKRKSNNKNKLYISITLLLLSIISGGYAILNSNLGISGILFTNKYSTPVIQSFSKNDTTKFRSNEYRDKIKTIILSNQINEPANIIQSWNLGINESDSVKGFLVTNESDSTMYDLHIQGNGKLIANPNSTYLFGGLTQLEKIDNLNILDTSRVTNMSYMFSKSTSLTSIDLNSFNTSKVINMSYMFAGDYNNYMKLSIIKFGNLWNTSNVTDMASIFSYCSNLTSIDLSNFNTSNVTNMSNMFNRCIGLTNLDLSSFNTSKVKNMSNMFAGDYNNRMKISLIKFGNLWNTSNVTDMAYLFSYCCNLTSIDVSNFNTSNVTNMSYMFYYCNGLTSLDVTHFNTSNVTNMSSMFYYCNSLTSLDVSHFDTSKVTDMSNMFNRCMSLKSINVSSFVTSSVTNMAGMFHVCSSLTSLDLSSFNTSNVALFGWMFCDCNSLTSLNLSGFDTSNVTTMDLMFYGCSSLTSLDLSSFNTGNVTDMHEMFRSCKNLVTIYVGNNWSINKVTNSSNMFIYDDKLIGAVAYDSTKVDATMANYSTGYLSKYGTLISYLKTLNTSDMVLKNDNTINYNMRYIGKTPNNYVTFSGEEWRIIGVFNNVDNGTGIEETRVKIVKNSSIGNKAWDSSNSNIWKNASINSELQATSYASNNMVDNTLWHLGSAGDSTNFTADQWYTYERGTRVAEGNDITWIGKVGLMYPSDYGFASSGCYNGTQTLYKYNNSTCKSTNWLFSGVNEWLLTPYSGRFNSHAHNVSDTGNLFPYAVGPGVYGNSTNSEMIIRPVVYLKSSVSCINCSDDNVGSQSNPFQIV